jgi:hypothetical protein
MVKAALVSHLRNFFMTFEEWSKDGKYQQDLGPLGQKPGFYVNISRK